MSRKPLGVSIEKLAYAADEAVKNIAQEALVLREQRDEARSRQREEKGDPFSLKERVKAQEEILRKISEATKYDGEEDFVWYVQDLMRHLEETQTIDGHPIEYWHQIATSGMKTNDELIDRVKKLTQERDEMEIDRTHFYETREKLREALREKERINADLEQQLKSAEILTEAQREDLRKAINQRDHQTRCAIKAENERDAALRELDAMREKLREATAHTRTCPVCKAPPYNVCHSHSNGFPMPSPHPAR